MVVASRFLRTDLRVIIVGKSGIVAIVLLVFGIGLISGCSRNSSASEVRAAWEAGERFRKEIESQNTANGEYPQSAKPSSSGRPMRYYKSGEDKTSYNIAITLGGRRELLVYFHGPLFEPNGWYHFGYNINGVREHARHAYP